MLILEGADCIGKTTTAKRICKIFDLQMRHMSRPDSNFNHAYEGMLGRHVQDRFHLGEVVYGRMLMGGGPYTSFDKMKLIQSYLRWQGCLTVIMYAEEEWLRNQLKKQYEGREEMYSVPQILAANEAYRRLATADNHGEPYCDVSFNVTDGWPCDGEITTWFMSWRY